MNLYNQKKLTIHAILLISSLMTIVEWRDACFCLEYAGEMPGSVEATLHLNLANSLISCFKQALCHKDTAITDVCSSRQSTHILQSSVESRDRCIQLIGKE